MRSVSLLLNLTPAATALRLACPLAFLPTKPHPFQVRHSTQLHSTSGTPPTTIPSSPGAETESTASAELLSLLLQSPESKRQSKNRIESLVSSLIQSPPPYDPTDCLSGPLYCTLYAFNPGNPSAPDPLWERVSLRSDNIKGQQYTTSNDKLTGNVINYSEIFGKALHLRAYGDFQPKPSNPNNDNDQNLRNCPDDFDVTVTQGSIRLFGLPINLPVRGTGFLRVLYADPKVRIFISPVDTEAPMGQDWEHEGLITVQVRSDLVSGGEVIELS